MAHHDPDLDRIFQALSDPTRRQMLARLGQGAVPVSELARPTGMALPTILRHLGVLEEAGLIATTKSGRTRLCQARPETLAWPSRASSTPSTSIEARILRTMS